MTWLKDALSNPYIAAVVACIIATAISVTRVYIIRFLEKKGAYKVAPVTMWLATFMLAMNAYAIVSSFLGLDFRPLIVGAGALMLFDFLFVKFPLPYRGGPNGK